MNGKSLPCWGLLGCLLCPLTCLTSRKSTESQQLLPHHSLPPSLKKRGATHKPQLHPCSGAGPREDAEEPQLLPSAAGWDFVRRVSAQAAFPRARLAGLKACGSLPNLRAALAVLLRPCLHRLPGSCWLLLSRRAGERVREGQMVLLCFCALKHEAFFQNQ